MGKVVTDEDLGTGWVCHECWSLWFVAEPDACDHPKRRYPMYEAARAQLQHEIKVLGEWERLAKAWVNTDPQSTWV